MCSRHGRIALDLMTLLYKHQVALIRAGQLQRGGSPAPGNTAAELAVLIARRRDRLGVAQYRIGCPA